MRLWERDERCSEVSGWPRPYLDEQAIFAAIILLFKTQTDCERGFPT